MIWLIRSVLLTATFGSISSPSRVYTQCGVIGKHTTQLYSAQQTLSLEIAVPNVNGETANKIVRFTKLIHWQSPVSPDVST
jgi:hypothetical protein